MTKKTQTPAALNWRTGTGYPEHGERTDLWAWEFLRRNPSYRADWQRFIAVADELRGTYSKPYDNLSDDWESDPGRPYWILSKAADDDGDMRARAFDPPALEGESYSAFCARVRSWKELPLHRAMGSAWGLESIVDPTQPQLGTYSRWELSPTGIRSLSGNGNNHEWSWYRVLIDLAEVLNPDPLPPDALQKARAILDQIPAAWDRRIAKMREEGDTRKRGQFILEFDLRKSIAEQLKHAGDWLEREQSQWKKSGGDVWSDGRKNKETPGYGVYLRVLDAIAEIGESNVIKWRKEIAAAMIKGYKPAATHDERKKHLDRVSAWVKRAIQLRDSEYRRLAAMAVKPTFSDSMKAAARKK